MTDHITDTAPDAAAPDDGTVLDGTPEVVVETTERPEPLPQTRVNAASQLADRLRAAIMDNSLPPDTRLSEVETAQQYGVSRQPVREAFIALAGQGLLDVRAQRGTFVTRISLAAVMDARFVREAIEAA